MQNSLGNEKVNSFSSHLASVKGTTLRLGIWTRLFPGEEPGEEKAQKVCQAPHPPIFLQRNHMPCHRSQEPQLPGNSIQARRPRHWSGCQETLPLMRLLSPSGAKTNRQNQLLDLEKVPETRARGDGGGGGGRVVSGLSSHEPGQPLPETNSRSTWHCLECFLWEILVNVYPLT